jgi:uncharacterized protein (TIGR02722 family)
MKKLLLTVCFAICAALFFNACSSSPKITRVDPSEQIDLSGQWNDTDSQLVSDEMIKDSLSSAWISEFTRAHNGERPRVIVGSVINKSSEHINTETFVKDLERALIASGKVRFVADAGTRGEIRQERMEQSVHARAETVKSMGNETGADFMLQGQINTITDSEGGKQVLFYQTELELVEILTNEKVWIGQKKIKKYVAKHKYKA